MATVSILGCGWLGLPLAKRLSEIGYEVKGSTTKKSKLPLLKECGIREFLIQLPEEKIDPDFFKSDYLVINIPPNTSKKGINNHLNTIKSIVDIIPVDQKIIYVSATSVYPKVNEKIDEEHPVDRESDRALALLQTENLLLKKFPSNLTVLRFGGLLGYDRIPGKYSAGKAVEQHQQKVNYIHRDDAIGIIESILHHNKWPLIMNGVAPKHPTKKEVFSKNATQFGFETPVFVDKEQTLTKRIIESSVIDLFLDYSFIYPDPLHFFYTN